MGKPFFIDWGQTSCLETPCHLRTGLLLMGKSCFIYGDRPLVLRPPVIWGQGFSLWESLALFMGTDL
jgi:hypothetical protein